MSSFPHIDHHDLLTSAMRANKLILFCGSGISLFAPTCLPTGRELKADLIVEIANVAESFGLPDPGFSRLDHLPLELLLGFFVEHIDDSDLETDVESIARFFAAPTPNRIHFLIATLLTHRSNTYVITTNYDTAIELALQQMVQRNPLPVDPGSVRVFSLADIGKQPTIAQNSIYKIHGCARLDQPESLVLTTAQESSGLPPQFRRILPALFSNSLVIFMGYSASEPDCLESLLEVDEYAATWVCRSEESFFSNPSALTVLGNASSSGLVIDLFPLIERPTEDLLPLIGLGLRSQLDSPALIQPDDSSRSVTVKAGLTRYRNLVRISDKASFVHALIQAFMWMRDFEAAPLLVGEYEKTAGSSRFWVEFWSASITRDKNNDWPRARDMFQCATLSASRELERFEAEIEKLGVESLVSATDQDRLEGVEDTIRCCISAVERALHDPLMPDRTKWYRLLGKAQKNLVQNMTYNPRRPSLGDPIVIGDKAAHNLALSRDINARIEAERFKARYHLRLYAANRTRSDLDMAISITHRVMLTFSLLGMPLGMINSTRQYALLLTLAGRKAEALEVFEELIKQEASSPDDLSRMKAYGLFLYMTLKFRLYWQMPKAFIRFVVNSANTRPETNPVATLSASFSWLRSFTKGLAG